MTTPSGDEVRVLVAGAGSGPVLALDEPLSFWGGVDPETGDVIDRRHPQHGSNVAGTVLVMPGGRGSSSASSVLAECLRLGTGPAAIVVRDADEILMLGSLVAGLLYQRSCPVVAVPAEQFARFRAADHLIVDGGRIGS